MANVLARLVDSAILRSSATALRDLWDHLGASAGAACAGRPRLTASLDQHAAAVRDAIGAGAGVIGPAALAGYAKGVVAAGAETQTWRTAAEVDWSTATWLELRLAAVGLLAHQHGHLAG